MAWTHTLAGQVHRFDDLKTLLARATPERSGDQLAGIAARNAEERMAARLALAENGGGLWGIEEAATTVTILQAVS